MILEMVAWRDPNLVPISTFYGDDIKVNFCGKLATDRHVQVRCTSYSISLSVAQAPACSQSHSGNLMKGVELRQTAIMTAM
jgi:hypothetical protein